MVRRRSHLRSALSRDWQSLLSGGHVLIAGSYELAVGAALECGWRQIGPVLFEAPDGHRVGCITRPGQIDFTCHAGRLYIGPGLDQLADETIETLLTVIEARAMVPCTLDGRPLPCFGSAA